MDFATKIEEIREAIENKDDFDLVDDDACSNLNEIENLLTSPSELIKRLHADIPDSEMDFATYSDKVYFDETGFFMYDSDGYPHYINEKYLTFK